MRRARTAVLLYPCAEVIRSPDIELMLTLRKEVNTRFWKYLWNTRKLERDTVSQTLKRRMQ